VPSCVIVQYTKLGKTGLTISRICLGCMSCGDKRLREWLLTEAEARDHFARALEAGINFFDTADVYSGGVSEQTTGRWLPILMPLVTLPYTHRERRARVEQISTISEDFPQFSIADPPYPLVFERSL
jgi:Aldo/keto reductase family